MASSISEAQAELISSLSPDDIPIKLRCAICSKLAINAFRLPCCEQAICESCQANLPQSCPVCEHSPISAEDCNPNKSLRTTIRVFLRTAEKKREASRPKEPQESVPAPSVAADVPEPAGSEATVSHGTNAGSENVNGNSHDQDLSQPVRDKSAPQGVAQVAEKDGEFHDGNMKRTEESANPTDDAPQDHDEQNCDDDGGNQLVAKPQGDDDEGNGQDNYGSETNNENFQNMMMPGSGDFNQMQMMMAMQNGMGGYSMMGMPGMPGMNLDPMAMQNMYMNGGFQGMGMNGMGGGFGGGFGQGSNNNWNNSQSWNFDQNNYNQNGIGMGAGDYGNFNSGFQTGYNQGNYGQFNDYRRNNFGRGRGRGRGFYGGYGRGGYQYNHNNMGNYQDQGQYSQQTGGNADQSHMTAEGSGDAVDGKPAEVSVHQDQHEEPATGEGGSVNGSHGQFSGPPSHGTPGEEAGEQGSVRAAIPVPDVPINAPTGPKAMRQGLPNTSLHNLRARGYQVGNSGVPQPHSPMESHSHSPSGPKTASYPQSDSHEHEKEQDAGHQHVQMKEKSEDQTFNSDHNDSHVQSRDMSRSRSERSTRSQSRVKSPNRSHRSSHRDRQQHSESVADDVADDSHRRKKYRSSRRPNDDEEQSHHSRSGRHTEKSRSVSPEESKRSSHRSHRDRDYDSRRDRDRDRDKDRYRDEDRQKSSHHSHRDKDYESSRRRDKERDEDRERDRDRHRKDRKDKDRHRDRDRDRDGERNRDRGRARDKKHGSDSRRASTEGRSTPAEKLADASERPVPGGSRGTHEKATRDRQSSRGSGSKPSTPVDPHTLEREARNRERLLKEAQRMAGLAGVAGSKHGREGGGDDEGSRKSRRTSRRNEARDGGGDEEDRMRRLEAEREGGRWG